MMIGQAGQVIIGLSGIAAMVVIRYRLLHIWWHQKRENEPPIFYKEALIHDYPDKKSFIRIYQVSNILSPLLVVFVMVGTAYLFALFDEYIVQQTVSLYVLLSYCLGSLEILRGVFTSVWGVDIVYGFMFRYSWQKYVVDDQIKQLGYLRIIVTFLIMVILGIMPFLPI